MSIFSSLDQALGSAAQSVANDASNVIGSALSGVQLQVKTNLGPPFLVGGLASSDGSSSPGLLSALGFKYNITVLGSDGKAITMIGDPPPTDPVVIAVYAAVMLGVGFLLYRGVRSMVQP